MVRARLGAASAILAVALSALLLASPVAAADAAGAKAVAYLFAAQAADGSLGGAPGLTEDYILGAAANGFDPATLVACSGKSALQYLGEHVSAATEGAGKTAKLILAVVAAHESPTAFFGTDLVAKLEADLSSGTGAYGDGTSASQSFAILALKAAGRPIPSAAIAYLTGLQDSDGSWNYGTKADSVTPDTNATGIALMALGAAGVTAPVAKALTWLHAQQLPTGGFPYQAGPGATSDPDSDATVIEGLVAVGESPTGATWSVGGKNALTDMLTYQAADGGFIYPGSKTPDTFTTSLVPEGIAMLPPDRTMSWTAGTAPATRTCSTPEPTAHPGGVVTATLPPTSTIDSSAPTSSDPRGPLAAIVLALVAGTGLALRRTARR